MFVLSDSNGPIAIGSTLVETLRLASYLQRLQGFVAFDVEIDADDCISVTQKDTTNCFQLTELQPDTFKRS